MTTSTGASTALANHEMNPDGLGRALVDIELEYSTPNVDLSQSPIEHLFKSSTLTFKDVRLLKSYFDALDFRRDPLVILPFELVVCVLENLDVEDFMTICCVSREWRKKFFHRKVCGPLLPKHFRGIWESIYKPLSEANKESRKFEEISTTFLDMCVKRLKRIHGKWHSTASHFFSENGENDFFYKNGRIATIQNEVGIWVKNLRTHTSTLYMNEQRNSVRGIVLSNELLVAYIDTPRPQFNVWSLNEEADPIVIHLESRSDNVVYASHNKQIAYGTDGFMARTKEVNVWVNGHIKRIVEPRFEGPNNPNDPWKLRLCGFIFHPIEENHYFLFYQPILADRNIIVQEYVAGLPRKTWSRVLLSDGSPFINAQLIDDDGLVALISEDVFDTRPYSTQPLPPCKHTIPRLSNPKLTFTTFNVFTQEFGMLSNHARAFSPIPPPPTYTKPYFSPPGTRRFSSTLRRQLDISIDRQGTNLSSYWRGQIIFGSSNHARSIDITGTPASTLLSVSTCTPHTRKLKDNDALKPALLKSEAHQAVTAFSLPFDDGTDTETRSKALDHARVWADDDFIVFSNDFGYTVWNFDPTVKLLSKGGELLRKQRN